MRQILPCVLKNAIIATLLSSSRSSHPCNPAYRCPGPLARDGMLSCKWCRLLNSTPLEAAECLLMGSPAYVASLGMSSTMCAGSSHYLV